MAKCHVCKKEGNWWFSTRRLFGPSVSYCSYTCKLIANRLWIYFTAVVLLAMAFMNLLYLIAGVIGIFIGRYASNNNVNDFPLLNWESIMD